MQAFTCRLQRLLYRRGRRLLYRLGQRLVLHGEHLRPLPVEASWRCHPWRLCKAQLVGLLPSGGLRHRQQRLLLSSRRAGGLYLQDTKAGC